MHAGSVSPVMVTGEALGGLVFMVQDDSVLLLHAMLFFS